jgi:hypothetical protein
MADMIAADGVDDMLGASLGREPRTMYADDHQFIWKFIGQVVEIRENMVAMQRTIRIKVEKDAPAFLLAQSDRTINVEPVQLDWKFREMTLFCNHRKYNSIGRATDNQASHAPVCHCGC